MAYIVLNNVIFSPAATIPKTATVLYKPQGDPDSSYVVVTYNALIEANGYFNPAIFISGLADGVYTVKVTLNCGSASFTKDFTATDVGTTTTTTTTTTSTTTTTTIAATPTYDLYVNADVASDRIEVVVENTSTSESDLHIFDLDLNFYILSGIFEEGITYNITVTLFPVGREAAPITVTDSTGVIGSTVSGTSVVANGANPYGLGVTVIIGT